MDMRAVLVALCLLLVSPITGHWWASGSQVVMDPMVVCKKTRKGRLAEVCKKEPAVLREITRGLAMGTKECQYQFRNRRWNCTNARRSMRKVLLRDTRETGFVNAIATAGVTFAVARACSTNENENLHCHCGRGASKGHQELHARGLQVPRAVGVVHAAHVLAPHAALPRGGRPPQGALRRRRQGHPQQRRLVLPPRRRQHHQAARPRRPRLLRGLARLLRAQPQDRLARHAGPRVQRHLPGRGGVRAAVLPPGLRHAQGERQGELRVPLQVVLRGDVPHVHGAPLHQHVPLTPPPRPLCLSVQFNIILRF